MIHEKLVIPKPCSEGKHTFIPAHWQIRSSSHDCTMFVCQHCLVSVDKSEREVMAKMHNEKAKEKIAKAERANKKATMPTKKEKIDILL